MNLLEVQRHFRGWLMEESSDAASRFGPGASAGLGVYLNNYRGQLLACLAETFATVQAWLGETAFAAAAATHIDRVPPSSWTLDDYAVAFPQTLGSLYPADPEVVDLACLEQALAQIFIAADCTPVTLDAVDQDQWASIDWDHALLRLVPTLLLPVTTNAAAIWSAIKAGREPPSVAALSAPTKLLLWRQEFLPSFRTLDSDEAAALEKIANGMTFGALCAFAVDRVGEAEGSQLAGQWLGQWLRQGIIAGISADPSPHHPTDTAD